MKISKIIGVIAIIQSVGLILLSTLKTIKTQMDLNNPLFPKEFIYNLFFQDIIKVIVLLCILLFQIIFFRKKLYIWSIFLLLLSIMVYNLQYFFQ